MPTCKLRHQVRGRRRGSNRLDEDNERKYNHCSRYGHRQKASIEPRERTYRTIWYHDAVGMIDSGRHNGLHPLSGVVCWRTILLWALWPVLWHAQLRELRAIHFYQRYCTQQITFIVLIPVASEHRWICHSSSLKVKTDVLSSPRFDSVRRESNTKATQSDVAIKQSKH